MPSSTCSRCDYCIAHDDEEYGVEFLCIAMSPMLVVYPDGSTEAARGAGIEPNSPSCIYWVPKANARH